MLYDVIIIGGGVVGCAIARELSQYQLNIALLEKNPEVCQGTSKANSAILHGGYDPLPGSLKAKLNIEGNALCKELSKTLDFPVSETGSLVLAFTQEEMSSLNTLLNRGRQNGVENLKILSPEEIHQMENGISSEVKGALYCPSAGIVCPFNMTFAFMENAIENGVEFFPSTPLTKAEPLSSDHFRLWSKEKFFDAKYVINAAGVYSDKVSALFGDTSFAIAPRRGEYRVLDKEEGSLVSHVLFQTPGPYGKGVLIAPTVHGNILIGPTSFSIQDKEDTSTTQEGIASADAMAKRTLPDLPVSSTIRLFSGLRAGLQNASGEADFFIQPSNVVPQLIHVAAIDSPGLVSSPAIAKYVSELLQNQMGTLKPQKSFIATRKGMHPLQQKSSPEYNAKIQEDPRYGHIVCRCEEISYGEILEAIHRPAGARTVDGIKRRARPGSGRCQGGFCGPRILEILSQELNISPQEVLKEEEGSFVLHHNSPGGGSLE